MIVAEIRYLPIPQDINVVAVPRYMVPHKYDKSYMDFLGDMPRVVEREVSEDGITFLNIIALKIVPVIDPIILDNGYKDYIVLERSGNCSKTHLKSGLYEIPSFVTEDGVRALQERKIKVKVYVHDDESEICEWIQSNKKPEAFVFYWETKYWGLIAGNAYIAYQAFYAKNRGHYLLLLKNKEASLEFGEERVAVRYNDRNIQYQVI